MVCTQVSFFGQLFKGEGLSWRLQVLLFLAGVIAVASRRPDALFNAQFYAEDGAAWFAQAYNLGWLHVLGLPAGGYLQTLPRLVAGLALLIPLRFAPLLMNCIGVALQVLPINILLSSRCSPWGSLSIRALYSGVYLALPNSSEIDANITDAHYHLALVAFLLATGVPAANWKWKTFDVSILSLSGLTGPWCIVLLPLVLAFWWIRRYPWTLLVACVSGLCAAIQALVLLVNTGSGARPVGHLGASPALLLRILGGQVFAGALVGHNFLGSHRSLSMLGAITVLGSGIVLYTFLESRLELKLFIVFCCVLLVASLGRPVIADPPLLQWPALLDAIGNRYWFLPMLAFIWSLVWCASANKTSFLRRLGATILLTMTIGLVRDWRYTPYRDKQFREYVEQFRTAAPGTLVEIPINPEGWMLRLTKK